MSLADRVAQPDVADLPDWQVAQALNAPDPALPPKRVNVPTHVARGLLLASGEWGGIVLLARSAPSVDLPAALIAAAITAEDTLRLTDEIEATDPDKWTGIGQMLGALVSAGVVSEATRDALLALASAPQSWAEANGYGAGVTERDVGIARGGQA